MRKKVDPEFEVLFASTYELYIKGEWEKAGEQAEQCLKMQPEDGPS